MGSNYKLSYAVDLVFCIDATESMDHIIDTVKSNALNFYGDFQAAMAAKRVFPELLKPDEEAEKYTAHIWLQRMGYKGPEMKEQRNILLKHLHGYCAFSNGAKMQNHKDKYAAIRRERREAERAAALENAVETIVDAVAPTTEAKPSVAEPVKEVAVNE